MRSVSTPLDREQEKAKTRTLIRETLSSLRASIASELFGVERTIDELFVALFARGHILLEDVPGVGKTALAKTFASRLGLTFRRIQCTPDMLPADIVGGLVFNPKSAEFQLRKGPVFANLLLVDEINRALPRTQSALLEAMAEGQVTIDGETHRLPEPFMVIATQNPVESQGVFPLPEAQIDRFLLKTSLGYPTEEEDVQLLERHALSSRPSAEADVAPLSDVSWLLMEVDRIRISRELLQYISRITHASRNHADVEVGASPRGMIMLTKASQAAALLAGRAYVTPDDVKRVAPVVLYHRLVFRNYDANTEHQPEEWITGILDGVVAPVDGFSR